MGKFAKSLEAAFQSLRAAHGRLLVRRFWREVQPRKVVFEQFHGNGFGCNMKYIALELLRRGGWDLVWLANKPAEGEYPPGIRVVARRSRAALRELATAGFWCANHNLGHFVRHCGLVKKPGQHYLQTWHGSFGIKCCHDVTSPEERSMVDAVLTNGRFGTEHMRNCFGEGPKVLPTGYPRCDILHACPVEVRREVCLRLGLSPERKFVLYAPTFRDDGNRSVYLTDYTALTAALAKRFGGEWTVLLRLHPNLRKHDAHLTFRGDARDVSTYEDIQELMVAADAMISDYSSCIFDYILTRKPAFLYVPDRARYESGRGLRYSLDKTPFPVCESAPSLVQAVVGFDPADFAAAEEKFLAWMESVERGTASARVADWMETQLAEKRLENRKDG
ncbi:MAG: CDP-glycerol glycerophosphotransferase family protein [Kiritimatiellia bacterium]